MTSTQVLLLIVCLVLLFIVTIKYFSNPKSKSYGGSDKFIITRADVTKVYNAIVNNESSIEDSLFNFNERDLRNLKVSLSKIQAFEKEINGNVSTVSIHETYDLFGDNNDSITHINGPTHDLNIGFDNSSDRKSVV